MFSLTYQLKASQKYAAQIPGLNVEVNYSVAILLRQYQILKTLKLKRSYVRTLISVHISQYIGQLCRTEQEQYCCTKRHLQYEYQQYQNVLMFQPIPEVLETQ